MSRPPEIQPRALNPEKVSYWYFRLNGFLQIENFVVHPRTRGSQRTDADLLAVRFPFRAERLFDDLNTIMEDDNQQLDLSQNQIDVVIAEVKTNQPCTLNGPWTQPHRQNVHRILAAIGCLPHQQIDTAADDIYRAGLYCSDALRIRLVAVGREQSDIIAADYPAVTQLVWIEMLDFIWDRLHRYKRQKTQVDQWDVSGRNIKQLADSCGREDFIECALASMGVRIQ